MEVRWLNMAVRPFFCSATFRQVLEEAGITPGEVNAAFDRLKPASGRILRADHLLLAAIRYRTGLNIVSVSRRHHYLLASIEQRGAKGKSWFYREHSRNHCVFSCPGTVPPTRAGAMTGKTLGSLADPPPALISLRIEEVDCAEGWSNVTVTPEWHAF
ncbi:hypothetical protein [Sphingomonas profundi]|uniref:hypothetical protein n=1 Tax=Alterirhizorhabdus profundi TaxID=2681549 RepID=UPI0012E97CE3|nr:hypothetical protein [Sphingomonas profundi]